MRNDENGSLIVIGGGQSGLAAAEAARTGGLRPIVLEAGAEPVGSWPRYYDSLTLFSPAEFSSIDGIRQIGSDPNCYPERDDVVRYLTDYANSLDVDIRTRARVTEVEATTGGFLVRTADGQQLDTAAVVAASGSFGNPHRPVLPGQETFAGQVLHVADYRNPSEFAGQRVVVLGAGNSAVQVAYELGAVAHVSLATRAPLSWMPQRRDDKDRHYWLKVLGFDDLPPAWLARLVTGPLVVDDGTYGQAEVDGVFDRRPVFDALDGPHVVWSDGTREPVDIVLLATGYRPDLHYLRELGALDPAGMPLHAGGISTTHLGLGYVGLEFQRAFSSNTLRGVRRDADYVMRALAGHLRGAARVLAM